VGITSVLVFGAGTNYALLLIARYREELRQHEDRHDAMRRALGSAAPAILASSSTVVLALLTLAFAVTPFNRAIGFAGAAGIVVAVVYALLVLPAAMVLFGRGLFWPFVPKLGQDDPTRTGVWSRVGDFVVRRPAAVVAGSLALIAVLAVGALGIDTGLSQTEQFRERVESIEGQEALERSFPAGSSQPTVVLTDPDTVQDVVRTVSDVDGVASARPSDAGDTVAQVDVILTAEPGSDESLATIEELRTVLDDVDGADALVGGPEAEALDSRRAAAHDRAVVMPLVLLVVLAVLLLLLRSVVAAVLLVLTVVATYLASLGVSWLALSRLFDFPAFDLQVPLLGFLFLVALGVDYNIFLTTRAHEETPEHGSRRGIVVALAVTGGVITSAGILLAAVFTVLGVLPLVTLTQLGVVVGFGVLLDTLLVRSVLVPALVSLVGPRFWWPSALARGRE
jgi:RND superfamily putative drug exporter